MVTSTTPDRHVALTNLLREQTGGTTSRTPYQVEQILLKELCANREMCPANLAAWSEPLIAYAIEYDGGGYPGLHLRLIHNGVPGTEEFLRRLLISYGPKGGYVAALYSNSDNKELVMAAELWESHYGTKMSAITTVAKWGSSPRW